MNNDVKTSDNIAGLVRLVGSLILLVGIALLGISQFMVINIEPNSENMNIESIIELPKKIADKTNFTLLGGLMIIVGLQLTLISNSVISEIKEQIK